MANEPISTDNNKELTLENEISQKNTAPDPVPNSTPIELENEPKSDEMPPSEPSKIQNNSDPSEINQKVESEPAKESSNVSTSESIESGAENKNMPPANDETAHPAHDDPFPVEAVHEELPPENSKIQENTPKSTPPSASRPRNNSTAQNTIRELKAKAQLAVQNRKRIKLDRLLTLFAKQTNVTNDDTENLLRVSDATATRYLSILKKEKKIIQNGKTGRGVTYSLK